MIPASYYNPIFLYLVLILTMFACFRENRRTFEDIRRTRDSIIPALFLCIMLALFIGGRPISGTYFGDTSNYALAFDRMSSGISIPSNGGEWIWNQFMYYCSQIMDVTVFLTIIDLGYFGFTLWACKRLTPHNTWIMLLFNLAAFSFFTYGTNGIRNGLACTLTLVALSFMVKNKKGIIIACVIAFLSINIHRTTALPLLMGFVSLYFIRSFKVAYVFWVSSILISLVAGGAVTSFFASLGFDDRTSYLMSEASADSFSHTGFRWDFLLYSMMPIVLGYYIIIRRGLRNRTYEFLLNTYVLSNAFWVMVIRANYSNRFAYLSWFMYPIVLAYPLLKMDIWGDQQGKRLSQIMLAHAGFTWFMSTIY